MSSAAGLIFTSHRVDPKTLLSAAATRRRGWLDRPHSTAGHAGGPGDVVNVSALLPLWKLCTDSPCFFQNVFSNPKKHILKLGLAFENTKWRIEHLWFGETISIGHLIWQGESTPPSTHTPPFVAQNLPISHYAWGGYPVVVQSFTPRFSASRCNTAAPPSTTETRGIESCSVSSSKRDAKAPPNGWIPGTPKS